MTKIKLQTGIDVNKSLKVRDDSLSKWFAEIKFNKKKAKYNYHSGLLAGMMVNNMVMLKSVVEQKNPTKETKEIAERILSDIIPMAKQLAEKYNWKMPDLENLAYQFFGDDE